MTLTVSVSELRGNISQYLDRVTNGARLLVRDEKRDLTIAQITKTSLFDKNTYEAVLKKAAGIFTAENHPEWETKSKVEDWITSNRLQDERAF